MGDHELTVRVEGDDDEETDQAARDLVRDVRETDLDAAVGRASGTAPPGAKGMADVLGAVTLTIGSGAVAPTVVMLHEWTKRRRKVCQLSVAIGTATLTFPDMTIDEAMGVLHDHKVLPNDPTIGGPAASPAPAPG